MLNTALSDEEKGIQDKESKEESILAMLGIIGTILNLVVIIFVYIYTTLWDPPESTGTMIGSEILARKNQAVPPGDRENTDTAATESHHRREKHREQIPFKHRPYQEAHKL